MMKLQFKRRQMNIKWVTVRVNRAYRTQKSLIFPVCAYMDEVAQTYLLYGRWRTPGSRRMGGILPLCAANCARSPLPDAPDAGA